MYRRFGKRVFDLTAAAIGLVVLALPMGIIAILVRATSRGPALFRQTRVGREGKLFTVRKFRTMSTGHGNPSPVTVRGDSRITGVGGVMRRFKIDEYPQLWNVLVGEMSLVGPRPDVPGYCDRLEGEARRILNLRPGITGPATIKYADEEEILAAQADPVRYNDEVIFPDKVRLNLEYTNKMSIRGDIGWIWQTIKMPFQGVRKTSR
jgi:lipopolysaccharide/colanic/teichoic acid biosynthesis glycosyltransferase